MNICLCWVPGHRDIPGNYKADELAREGTTTELQSLHNDYGIPIASLKLQFEDESIRKPNLRWLKTSVCRQIKLIWLSINKKRSLDLLSLKRNNILKTIGVLTGHWLFGKHGNRLGIITKFWIGNRALKG